MKIFLLIAYIVLLQNALALAQKRPLPDDKNVVISSNYVCYNTASYIPRQPQYSPIKKVRLVLHIFAKADGSGNLQNTPEHKEFLERIMNHLNWFYRETEELKPATSAYTHITDSRIRFVVDTILFHKDDDAWDFKKYVTRYRPETKETVYCNPCGYSRGEALYEKFVRESTELNSRQEDSALHIFFVEAQGYQNRGMAESIVSKRWVYSIGAFHHYNNGKNHWDPGLLLAHEIGHALGLVHPFEFQQCDDLPVYEKGRTNDMMDTYPNEGRAITPCQMGILHSNLTAKTGSVADIVVRDWCRYIPDSVIRIPAGDTVYFKSTKYFFQDVYIEADAVLVLNCTMALPAGASVYVEEKGTLIIDGGTITNNCGQKWKGVRLEKRGKILGLFKRKTKAVLIMQNGAKIENVEQNVKEAGFE